MHGRNRERGLDPRKEVERHHQENHTPKCGYLCDCGGKVVKIVSENGTKSDPTCTDCNTVYKGAVDPLVVTREAIDGPYNWIIP